MNDPSENFTIEDATRAGVKELIGLVGYSSGGKTRSGLILARGLVGPAGRIGVIDTENKRASMFSDVPPGPACPGKYRVINLDAPFSPERYMGALKTFEQEADVVMVDSMTHEWSGEGGVQDLHEEALDRMLKNEKDDYKARASLNWPAWNGPKREHKALLMYLLRYPLPLILCFRGKSLSKMVKDEKGKNTVVTEKFPVADFDQRFIFEMLVAGEVFRDVESNKSGLFRAIKVSREEVLGCFPKDGEQFTLDHGKKLVAWCKGQAAPAPASADPKKKLLIEIRDATVSVHGWTKAQSPAAWDACKLKLSAWLVDELGIDTLLSAQSEEELKVTLAKAKAKLST